MAKIDLPKPEDMGDERYFEIRDVDRDGCGTTSVFVVSADSSDEDIQQIACDTWTEYMEGRESVYFPSPFREPPKWRSTIKVVEQKRLIRYWNPDKENERKIMERSGKNYRSEWTTKRGGMKFTIVNSWVRITTNLGVRQSNGYRPGQILTASKPERKNKHGQTTSNKSIST